MKFQSKIENLNSNLWGYHIKVPIVIAEQFIEGKDRRIYCKLNDIVEFPCALMHKGDGGYFINVNKEIRTKVGVDVGSLVEVEIWKDESQYGMPMPEEFLAVLESDQEAWDLFHALTPGKQRSLMYYVGKPKKEEARIQKALIIVEHLMEQGGKVDFPQLQQDFKDKKDR